MYVLGIDPGNHSGIAVVSIQKRPRLMYHRDWDRTKKGTERPTHIIKALADEYYIQLAVIEDQYLDKAKKQNVKTMSRLTKTAGNWEEACLSNLIPVDWVYPKEWQSRIIGRIANKRDQLEQMYRMIAKQDTDEVLTTDEAAAWCIGKYAVVNLMDRRIKYA